MIKFSNNFHHSIFLLFILLSITNSESGKKCRKLEDIAIKNFDFNKTVGKLNALYTSNTNIDKNCTHINSLLLNHNVIDYTFITNCVAIDHGLLTKCPPYETTAKIIVSAKHANGSHYVLDSDYVNYFMTYSCFKFEINGKIEIKDTFKIISKDSVIDKIHLERAENILKSISSDLHFTPIEALNCTECGDDLVNVTTSSTSISLSDNNTSLTTSLANQTIALNETITKHKCEKVGRIAVKTIDFYKWTGKWYLLLSSKPSESDCTTADLKPIHEKSLEMILNVDCNPVLNLLLQKCSPNENKLVSTDENTIINSWIIDINSNDYILTYLCVNREINGKSEIIDEYKLFSRQKTINESVLLNVNSILKSISSQIKLKTISHSNCECAKKDLNSNLITNVCRNLKDKAVDEFNFSKISGHWNLVMTTNPSDVDCLQIDNEVIHDNSFESTFNVKCNTVMNLLIQKCFPKKLSSKLIGSFENTTFYNWILDIGSTDHLLMSVCSQQYINGNTITYEFYRLFSRQKFVSESIVGKADDLLKSISNNNTLRIISQTSCNCDNKTITSLPLPTNLITPVITSNKCKNLDKISLSKIDLYKLTGRWNLLLSSKQSDCDCTSAQFEPLHEKSIEMTLNVECNPIQNLLIQKCPPRERSSKLVSTDENTIFNYWILDIDSDDYILIYVCDKRQVNGEFRTTEYYRLFSRQNVINKSILHNVNSVLRRISIDIKLKTISQSNCECNKAKTLSANLTGNYLTTVSKESDITIVSSPTINETINRSAPTIKLTINGNAQIINVTINGSTQTINRSAPTINGSAPTINESAPIINRRAPTINGSAPTINGSAQTIDEEINDSIIGSAPIINRSAPTINGSTPTINESAPTINGSAPTINGSAQTIDEEINDTIIGSAPTINGSAPTINVTITSSAPKINETTIDGTMNQSITINNSLNQTNVLSKKMTEQISTVTQNHSYCDEVEDKALKKIDFKKLSGKWKQIYISNENINCSVIDLDFVNDNKLGITLSNDCNKIADGVLQRDLSEQNTGKLFINTMSETVNIWILDFDSNYFLFYQCLKNENLYINNYGIMSRTDSIPENILQGFKAKLNSSGIILNAVSHNDCQCNSALPIIHNFNINKIGGHWELLLHSNSSKSCYTQIISDTDGQVLTPAMFTDAQNGDIKVTGLYEMIGNAKFMRRIKGFGDQITTVLYVDNKFLVLHYINAYISDTNNSTDNNRERIAIFGRTLQLSDWIPSEIHELLSNIGKQVHKLDNSKCKAIEVCSRAEKLALSKFDYNQISGKWFSIYSSDETKCINYEIEKRKSKRSNRRWFHKRQSSDIINTDILTFESNGVVIQGNGGEKPILRRFIDIEYDNYLVLYRCQPNNNLEVDIFSRSKDPDTHILKVTNNKLRRVGVEPNLKSVDQINCDYEEYEGIACKPLTEKTVLNIDLNRYRGDWYSVYLNTPNARCLKVQDNNKSLSDPSNKGEYWYDTIDENGLQYFGRLKVNDEGSVTNLNFKLNGDKIINVLDIDYDSYHIYYQCAIGEIDGIKRKLVEYGILSRKPSLSTDITEKARKIFFDIGVGEVFPVDQHNCHYENSNQTHGLTDNHCKNAESFVVKNLDLDKLTGKWLAHYVQHPGHYDITLEISKNPNITSKYSHIYNIRYDERIFRGGLRLGQNGIMFATSDNHPTVPEIQMNILDVDYVNHLTIYKCAEFDGSLSRIEYFRVFSRTCDLDTSVRVRAEKLAKKLGLNNIFSQVKQFQCRDDLKFGSHVLSQSCIHFHNIELLDCDFDKVKGEWDNHLTTANEPFIYVTKHYVKLVDKNNLEINSTGLKILVTKIHNSFEFKLNINGNIGIGATLSADYNNYILNYECIEYEQNGYMKATGYLYLRKRLNSNITEDELSNIITQIPAFTLNKIKSLIASLTQHKTEKRQQFGQNIKENIFDIVNKYQKQNNLSPDNDIDVYHSLINKCRHFSADEIPSVDIITVSNNWNLDFTNYFNENSPYDKISIMRKFDHSDISLFENNKLLTNGTAYHRNNGKIAFTFFNGRRGINIYLMTDKHNLIIYYCFENQINNTFGIIESLKFYSVENFNQTKDWYSINSYIEQIISFLKPKTFEKIKDLLLNMKSVKQQLSDSVNNSRGVSNKTDDEVYDYLNRNCRPYNEVDLVEPNFDKVSGVWNVDYASWLNTYHPYDSLEMHNTLDKLEIITSLNSNIVARGYAQRVNGSKYLRQKIDGRRGIEAYLWADYDNHLILYLCQENQIHGVLKTNEAIRLLSRFNTTNGREIEAYQSLITSQPKYTLTNMITELVTNLRPLIKNPTINKIDEFCPNYESIAQKDIDFSNLTGKWVAIFTSDRIRDIDCVHSIDSYDSNTNSINIEKHTNNKTHYVVMKHTNTSGRQEVTVDNIAFQAWILATDYKTYKLVYTCYVKEIKGNKRRIDLQRLYTKGIEANNFDKNILEMLKRVSADIGRRLDPIDRSKC